MARSVSSAHPRSPAPAPRSAGGSDISARSWRRPRPRWCAPPPLQAHDAARRVRARRAFGKCRLLGGGVAVRRRATLGPREDAMARPVLRVPRLPESILVDGERALSSLTFAGREGLPADHVGEPS